MTININKLRGKIVESGLTVAELAQKIGIDRSTLYRKLSNDGDTMLVKDANAIVAALNLSADDAVSIFLIRLSHDMRIIWTIRRWVNDHRQSYKIAP